MTTDADTIDLSNCAFGPALKVKFDVGERGELSGYASVAGNVDSAGERVLVGAFTKSLAAHRQQGTAPVMLWQHRVAEPIGKWTRVEEDGIGLQVAGVFNLNTTRGRDAWEHVRAGDVNGLSIGYQVIRSKHNGPILDLHELKILECSVCSLPANPRARITGVKFDKADIERVLREGGMPRAAAQKLVAGGLPLLSGKIPDPSIERIAASIKASTEAMHKLKEKFR